MKFSVLMSIYDKEKTIYFNRAMESIWDGQTVKPNEIILVKDGSLTEELEQIIDIWKNKIGKPYKIISLKENIGLGDALNMGLNACSYDLVARMDTDDISALNRFEKQLEIFENSNIDICGSWVSEFDKCEDEIVSYRKVPKDNVEIKLFAKKRNPMNHPTVMFKKEVIYSVGGYRKILWFEDYYLWVRLILKGAVFYNIQEPLVHMRAGYRQLERRSGLQYALSEIKLQRKFLKLGFIDCIEVIRNISIRFMARIVPKYIVRQIYQKLRS